MKSFLLVSCLTLLFWSCADNMSPVISFNDTNKVALSDTVFVDILPSEPTFVFDIEVTDDKDIAGFTATHTFPYNAPESILQDNLWMTLQNDGNGHQIYNFSVITDPAINDALLMDRTVYHHGDVFSVNVSTHDSYGNTSTSMIVVKIN